MNKIIFLLVATFTTFNFCRALPNVNGKPITHEAWNKLLKKHVDSKGFVDYKGFIKDSVALNSYLKMLSDNEPADSWQKDEKLAFWINAYNAFTVKLIIDHYPVKSIKDIGSKIQIPFVNTPWQKKFIQMGDKKIKLDDIENNIIRKKFTEPRIHFAIVCASISCPKLRNEAYEASKLDAQLTDQAKAFLSDPTRNKPDATNPKLSHIFQWFNGDFEKTGLTKIEFINKYSPIKINADANIDYMNYDWGLNEQK
ncbi:MAG: DUF547 domain-containing protein [Pedobacter sp.]|nr:DUF547 domain-containing protein [Chitinophagaceae bacterium]